MVLECGLRLAFAGTPEFARVALQAIIDAGCTVGLVLTQPDRPAGRGLKLVPSPVKALALDRGIPVAQPRGLKLEGRFADDAAQARAELAASCIDVMVVAAYGLILPVWVLELPRLGCLNIHASRLPRWRGAAPIHRAIEAGDQETGVAIMQMDAGLDTGEVLLEQAVPIEPHDTTGQLHDRLAALGGGLIVQALRQAAAGLLDPRPQPEFGITYARKIDKCEGVVDWSATAEVIERRIRAFDPAPGSHTLWQGQSLKLWRARVVPLLAQGHPGTVLAAGPQGLRVVCGSGTALEVTELQRAGGRRLAASQFFQGHSAEDWVGGLLG